MTNLEFIQTGTQEEVAGALVNLILDTMFKHGGPVDINKWLESETTFHKLKKGDKK